MNSNTPRLLWLPTFDGVAASSTCKCVFSLLHNYHSVTFEIGDGASATDAAILANVTEITFKRDNGRVFRTITGAELNALNARNNNPGETSYSLVSNGAGAGSRKIYLTVYFVEPWLENYNPAFALSLAIDARRRSNLWVEVKFGAAVTPTISGWCRADQAPRSRQGLVCEWERTNLTLSGTDCTVPNLTADGFLRSISIANPAAGAFTEANLDIEGIRVHESDDTHMAVDLAQNEMTRQTGRYDIILDHNDNVDNAPLVTEKSELKLRVKCGAAMASTPAIIEKLVAWD